MKKLVFVLALFVAFSSSSCRKEALTNAIEPTNNLDEQTSIMERAGSKYNLGLSYTVVPSIPNWTAPSTNASSTCGSFSGGVIRAKITAIDGDVVWVTVSKADGTAFTFGGTVYVKFNGVCGTLAKLESHTQTYTGNFNANVTSVAVPFVMVPGVSQVVVTMTSSGGGRYHCSPFTFSASGWMNAGDSQIQKNILGSARSRIGSSPGLSTTSVGNSMWLTDMAGGDGTRWRNAINVYHGWKLAPGNTSLSSIKSTMKSKLAATYNATDQTRIVDRIIAVYNPNIPSTDDQTLTWMGVRQQCMEFVGKTSINNGGVYKPYGSTGISDKKLWRPGMAVYLGSTHAMVLSEIQWINNAPTNNIRVVESNYASTFGNPVGQIPWERLVANRSVTFSSSYKVVTLDN